MFGEILPALLLVACVAALAGIMLALASKFFKVEEDETVKKIREALPGANCGACGYAGCDEYAKAVAEGKAEPNLCIPGGSDVAEEVSGIMGVEAREPEDLVAFVACNGNCEATSKKAIYDGITTCVAAGMVYGGPNVCRFGCLGCGDCVKVCPVNAICLKDGIAHVDPRICIGCKMCAKACPKNIIKMLPAVAKVAVMCNSLDKGAESRSNCKNSCIACKKCEKICPSDAIKVENNLSKIDYNRCIACLECVKVCPTGCIKQVNFEENGEL